MGGNNITLFGYGSLLLVGTTQCPPPPLFVPYLLRGQTVPPPLFVPYLLSRGQSVAPPLFVPCLLSREQRVPPPPPLFVPYLLSREQNSGPPLFSRVRTPCAHPMGGNVSAFDVHGSRSTVGSTITV